MKSLVLAAALALPQLALAQSGESPLSGGITAAQEAVPEDLSQNDWASIRAAYDAGRHAAVAVERGYQVRNPGQGWRTHFDGRGFLVEPDTGGWTWGLKLKRYGFAGAEQEAKSPERVDAEGGRVAYDWDDTLEEWYVNDTRGLEHGYTVHRRPTRDDEEGPLTFTLAVRGELRPEVVADGRGVRFVDEGGAVALTYTGLTVLDADGQELEASFECVGNRLLLSVEERSARYPLVIDPIAQQAYLKAGGTDASDEFGYSVAASGDTVVVGARTEDGGATGVNGNQSDNSALRAGAVYVFVRSGTSWSQEAYLKASNTGASDFFGVSVAVSGNTVVVGASGEASNATGVDGNQGNNSANGAGAAYVFVRSGTSWSQEAYLKPSNTDAFDNFGSSVALSGDTVVVGADSEDSSSTGVGGNQNSNSALASGAAYVFVRSGMTWNQEAYLKASNTEAFDFFGRSVAVSGGIAVVGAALEASSSTGVGGNQSNNSATDAGAAYVFVRSGTSWSQEAYLKASNTEAFDRFGESVAVSGDTLLVGAFSEDSNATGVNGNQNDNSTNNAGAAYVFVRSGTSWSQEAYLKASNPGFGDRFGWSVGVSGDTVVVGADSEDSNATGVNGNQSDNSTPSAGAAYVFVHSDTSWSQEAYLKASNTDAVDFFGWSVAVSEDTVVVGARGEDSNGTGVNGNQGDNSAMDAGAAYVFSLGIGTNYCVSVPNSSGNAATISASGSTSVAAQLLSLEATGLPPGVIGIFYYGTTQLALPFGDGLRCVGGVTQRLPLGNQADGNGVLGEPDVFALSMPNVPLAPGTLNFQAWYRDSAAMASGFNLSDGLSILFTP